MIDSTTDRTALLLEVSNVTKKFPGVLALDGVSLKIRPGEVHALMGENGAGKSTLMKIIGGIHKANGGYDYLQRPTLPAGWACRCTIQRRQSDTSGAQSGAGPHSGPEHFPRA